MRAVIQRVRDAAVSIDGRETARIGPGLLIFLGVAQGDTADDATRLAVKVAQLRVFAGTDGRFDRSLVETGGEALVVSQFTLLADVRRGRRPSFTDAAEPSLAEPLCAAFADAMRGTGISTQTGVFGAQMLVELANDGPVTMIIDSADLERPRRGQV